VGNQQWNVWDIPPKKTHPISSNTTTSSYMKTCSYSSGSSAHTSPRLQPPSGTLSKALAIPLQHSHVISPEETKFNWMHNPLTVSEFNLIISKHYRIILWEKLLEELFIVNVNRCMLSQCLFIDFLINKTLQKTVYSFNLLITFSATRFER
jgi:hypothetical protein